ncbi:hypothetical protein RRG08_000816, partial [Elysia crispata]
GTESETQSRTSSFPPRSVRAGQVPSYNRHFLWRQRTFISASGNVPKGSQDAPQPEPLDHSASSHTLANTQTNIHTPTHFQPLARLHDLTTGYHFTQCCKVPLSEALQTALDSTQSPIPRRSVPQSQYEVHVNVRHTILLHSRQLCLQPRNLMSWPTAADAGEFITNPSDENRKETGKDFQYFVMLRSILKKLSQAISGELYFKFAEQYLYQRKVYRNFPI